MGSTYKHQSTNIIRNKSLWGKPTESRTNIIVTKPPEGIAAAPLDAIVAVMLSY
jgi:hypothetical protein